MRLEAVMGGHHGRGGRSRRQRRQLLAAGRRRGQLRRLPPISAGIDGYPTEEAATIAVDTIRATPTAVKLVRLVAFDDRTLGLYETRLA